MYIYVYAANLTIHTIYTPYTSPYIGDPYTHLKRTLNISNQHYPERSYVIFVVNAPSIASLMWRLVKPMIHPNTQKKVSMLCV